MNKILRKAIMLRSKLKNQANKSKVTRDIKMYKQQRHLEVRLNKDSKYSYFSNLHIRKESKPVLEQLPRRKIAPNSKTNLNPNPNPNRGYFSSGAIVWLPPNPKINPNLDPNPNPNQGGGGDFPRGAIVRIPSKPFWNACKPYFTNKHSRGHTSIMLVEKEELILSEKKICSIFNTYFGNTVQSLNLFQWSGSLLNNQRLR